MRKPEDLAESLVKIIEKGEHIQDTPPQNIENCEQDQLNKYAKVIDEMMAEAEPEEPELEL